MGICTIIGRIRVLGSRRRFGLGSDGLLRSRRRVGKGRSGLLTSGKRRDVGIKVMRTEVEVVLGLEQLG